MKGIERYPGAISAPPPDAVIPMATKPVTVEAPAPAPEWTPDEVRALIALEKAAKYWTATPEQEKLFLELDGPAIVSAAPRKRYGVALDVDRLYLESDGPAHTDPAVRELALKLRKGGCKAHAVAFLTGIPPRFVSGMWAAAEKARATAPAAAA